MGIIDHNFLAREYSEGEFEPPQLADSGIGRVRLFTRTGSLV
jgi:hypothetical protein